MCIVELLASGSKNRANGSKNKTGHGDTTEEEVKKDNRKNKKERKLKKKDFIKRNILVCWLMTCFVRKNERKGGINK